MEKLTKQEIIFIKGCLESGVYLGNLHYFTAKDYYDNLQQFLSSKQKIKDRLSHTYEILSNLHIECSTEQIKNLEDDLKKRENMTFLYEIIERTGLKTWFENRKIIKVKRPETYGNKGDYTGDEDRDLWLSKNTVFVKLTDTEYDEYVEMSYDEDTYTEWYYNNETLFTKIILKD